MISLGTQPYAFPEEILSISDKSVEWNFLKTKVIFPGQLICYSDVPWLIRNVSQQIIHIEQNMCARLTYVRDIEDDYHMDAVIRSLMHEGRGRLFPNYILTHWGRSKMSAILQTTFSHAFSSMKMYEFRFRFYFNLFPINNISALVQIMAWHRPGDKPLSEPMMVSLLTHICITRPPWVICIFWWYVYLLVYKSYR